MNIRQIIFQILVNAGLMTAVTLVFTLLLLPLRRVQSARIRSYIWWILAIGFLLPFKPHLFGTVYTMTGRQHWTVSEVQPNGSVATVMHTSFAPGYHLLETLFIIWLIGAAAAGLVMLYRHAKLQKSITRLRQPADEHIYTALQMVCLQTGCASDIAVYTLPVLTSPMMTGLTQPAIYLPQQSYSDEELRLILKHELMHRKRRDLLCKLLWMFCRVIYWFVPLMPLFIREMEQDAELACDEAVMEAESPETAAVYCSSILKTAANSCRRNRGMQLTTGFSCSREMLRSRMQAILEKGLRRRLIPLLAGTAVLVALTGSAAAYAEEHIPNDPAYTAPPEIVETSAVMTTVPATTPMPQMYETAQSAVYTEPPADMRVETTATAYFEP